MLHSLQTPLYTLVDMLWVCVSAYKPIFSMSQVFDTRLLFYLHKYQNQCVRDIACRNLLVLCYTYIRFRCSQQQAASMTKPNEVCGVHKSWSTQLQLFSHWNVFTPASFCCSCCYCCCRHFSTIFHFYFLLFCGIILFPSLRVLRAFADDLFVCVCVHMLL